LPTWPIAGAETVAAASAAAKIIFFMFYSCLGKKQARTFPTLLPTPIARCERFNGQVFESVRLCDGLSSQQGASRPGALNASVRAE
jgi:hypothetical protein